MQFQVVLQRGVLRHCAACVDCALAIKMCIKTSYV